MMKFLAVVACVFLSAMSAQAMGRAKAATTNDVDNETKFKNALSRVDSIEDRFESGLLTAEEACQQFKRIRRITDSIVAFVPQYASTKAALDARMDEICGVVQPKDTTQITLDVKYIPSLTVELKDKTVLTEKDIALVFVREDPVYELPALKSRTATYTAEEFRNRILGKDPALIPPEQPEPPLVQPIPGDPSAPVPVDDEQAAINDVDG